MSSDFVVSPGFAVFSAVTSTPDLRQQEGANMATYRKRGNTWRAEIAKNGARLSATFVTKPEAVAWATEKEADLRRGGPIATVANNKTFADAVRRYELEVSPTKKGERWEKLRLAVFLDVPWAGERIGKI